MGVKEALLVLMKEVEYWPDKEERVRLSELNWLKYCCPNARMHGDGTFIDFAFEPQCHNYGDYHGRKL